VEHVAAIAGLPEPETDRALRSLVNRSLVVPNDELTAFTLVPMVADFLRKKRPDVVAETGDRLEKRAYTLIVENGYQNYDRFPLLEAAWPGIAPALTLFLAGDNQRLQTVCNALANFLNFQGREDEQLALSEKAEARAVADAYLDLAGRHAYITGFIHYLRRQADAVLACADRANEHWTTAKAGAFERALAIRLRGLGHQLKREYPAAITAFHMSLDLFRNQASDSENMAVVLNDIANLEQSSGNFDDAETHFLEVLRIARGIGSSEIVAGTIGNLAILAINREDWPTAETIAREALALSEGVHSQEQIARNNRVLAKALMRQGRAAEALPHARRAIVIYARLDHPDLAKAQAILTECGG